jgi:DNA-binding protein HU-beta
VNKAELVGALAERLGGDRGTASAAVDGLLDVIVRTVGAGESVSVAGFGVFERRERAARSGRNPRTGQAIQVPAAVVPAFRPGAYFRDVVSGVREPMTARVVAGHQPVSSTATGRPPARSAPIGDPLARPAATRPPVAAAANKAVKPADIADEKVGKGKGSGKASGKNAEPAGGRGSAKSGNGSTKDSGKGAGKASGKDAAKASGKNGKSVGGKAKKKAKK